MSSMQRKEGIVTYVVEDGETLSSKLVGLEHIGVSFRRKQMEDGKYKMVKSFSTKEAAHVANKHVEELSMFTECLSERVFDVLHADQDIMEYHLSMNMDGLGQELYAELCGETKNLSFFKNYVLFLDSLLKKKRSAKSKVQRKSLMEVYDRSEEEIVLLVQMADELISIFTEGKG